MPSHGNASNTGAGNGRENFQMKGDKYGDMQGNYVPGMAGGRYMQQQCHFPQAPPARCYCQPAAFSSLDGRKFQRLLDAYGNSRPCAGSY